LDDYWQEPSFCQASVQKRPTPGSYAQAALGKLHHPPTLQVNLLPTFWTTAPVGESPPLT
jgi:hypothetical protein